jgi:hypothetical protein
MSNHSAARPVESMHSRANRLGLWLAIAMSACSAGPPGPSFDAGLAGRPRIASDMGGVSLAGGEGGRGAARQSPALAGMGGRSAAGGSRSAGHAGSETPSRGSAGRAAAAAGRDAGARDPASQDSGRSTPTNAADEDDAGTACMPLQTVKTLTFAKCPAELCPAQDSVCVPSGQLTALAMPPATAAALADCDAASKCVPSRIVEQMGHVLLAHCVSLAGAEGRCVSSCAGAGDWPQDSCPGAERCAPCYDPRDGSDTGACHVGCDSGPQAPARSFAACCAGRGLCMPPALVDAATAKLVQSDCADDTVCAPRELTDSRFTPKSCASLDGAEGRCLSTCLGPTLSGLPVDNCGTDELCTPCFDPLTGHNTGACDIHGDAPLQPAHTYARCCDNGRDQSLGVCVTAAIAGAQAHTLRRDSCAADRLCAPTAKLANPNYQYALCLGPTLGACAPSCLFDPLESLLWTNVLCDAGEVCAPCSSLLDPSSAGLCD